LTLKDLLFGTASLLNVSFTYTSRPIKLLTETKSGDWEIMHVFTSYIRCLFMLYARTHHSLQFG